MPICQRHDVPLRKAVWNEMTEQYYCPVCLREAQKWERDLENGFSQT